MEGASLYGKENLTCFYFLKKIIVINGWRIFLPAVMLKTVEVFWTEKKKNRMSLSIFKKWLIQVLLLLKLQNDEISEEQKHAELSS